LSTASGLFNPGEIDLAVELVLERLSKGQASGYHFLIAEYSERPVGYACFGPIPLTRFSYDLYWIAVARENQGLGHGFRMLEEVEARVREWGGSRIYVETSDRPEYITTRLFYQRQGYREAAFFPDFYNQDEAKVVFLKILDPDLTGAGGPSA
jgi:GNAT superfamily N-acetyltransferase